MSILIKGAKPPSGCAFCYFNVDSKCALIPGCNYDETNGWQRREDCPLIELPDHGDLIDRNALYIDLMDRGVDQLQLADFAEIAEAVDDAPAIIKAERSEE